MRDSIHRIRSSVRLPRTPPVAGVVIVLAAAYATIGLSALAVVYGATMLTLTRVGPHAATVVGGLATFGFAYVVVRIVDDLANGGGD